MNVLITGNLPKDILNQIRSEHDVEYNDRDEPFPRERLLEHITDKHGLLCMITDRIDGELFERAPGLRMAANCAVGYDNIDVAAATERGILVSNTPGVLTDATADLTLALILGIARRVVEGDKMTREGRFKFWAPFFFLGREVTGKTLGIVGLGSIGKAVAKRAAAFDLKVLYHSRHRLDPGEEARLDVQYRDLKDLLTQSDFVSLHVPLTDATRHLIGREELNLMKPSAYLINAARGPVVDERALLEALRTGAIAGAGLDVYEHEPAITPGLESLDNAILLPHVGSATLETRTKMAALAAENLLAGLRGETPPNCLNCRDVPG